MSSHRNAFCRHHSFVREQRVADAISLIPRCSACGYTASENREDRSIFHCKVCDHTTGADVNAAINILLGGLGSRPAPTPGERLANPGKTIGRAALHDGVALGDPDARIVSAARWIALGRGHDVQS
jgi:hypothetical protein